MKLEFLAKIARGLNKILGYIVRTIVFLMLLFALYSLWDIYTTYTGAFVSQDILKMKPKPTPQKEDLSLSFSDLRDINPDVKGWISLGDTHIDHPFVQGKDETEYVNKDIYGEFSLSGAIFLSTMNSPDMSDFYNMLYGHHMEHHGMFGDVMEFQDSEYFESHKKGILYTDKNIYDLYIVACVKTDAYDQNIYGIYNINKNRDAFLSYIRDNSVNYRDFDVDKEDSFVALSTCAEAITNGRVILIARMRKIDR